MQRAYLTGENLRFKNSGLMRVLVIFMILPLFISFAQAFELSQLQWDQGISGKLQRDDVLTYEGYSVKAEVFPLPVESDRYRDIPDEPVDPFIGLNISKNGSFVDLVILKTNESYILPDGELKVATIDLPTQDAKEWLFESYAPWGIVELSPRGTPNLEVSIATDKDNYISSSAAEIVTTVQLENTGSADAINVDIRIDTELVLKKGSLKYHYNKIKKGELITETIVFSPSLPLVLKEYGILANATGYDVKDIPYTSEYKKVVTIEDLPEQGLYIMKNANNRIYLKDFAMISILAKNNGKDDLKNVSISDSLPKDFKLVGNNTLHWVTDIPAGGEWGFRYLIKPQEPNKDGIVLPSAVAEFKKEKESFVVRSNQPKIKVYGAMINLTKQSNVSEIYLNETMSVMTVTVTAENTGNTPTKAFIKDGLPENATVIFGNTTHEEFLEANKTVSFNYSVIINSAPPIRLPPAIADYYKLGFSGEKINTSSKELVIGIKTLDTTPLMPLGNES